MIKTRQSRVASSALFSVIRRMVEGRRSLSLIDQAVVSATNMGTSIIIGRTCERSELGLYASGLSLVLFATAVQAALITVPYTIASPRIPFAERAWYKGSTILQQNLLALIAMSGFFIASLIYAARAQHEFQRIFVSLGFVAGLICLRDFVRRISYAELRFRFALFTDVILAILQLGLVAFLARDHELSGTRALLCVGIASTCGVAIWFAANWSSIRFSIQHALQGFGVNWSLGRWLFSSSVLWSICIDQYPWLITALSSASNAAIWASSAGVMAFLNPVVLALNNDAAPRISHDFAKSGAKGLSHSVYRASGVAALTTLPILLAILACGSRMVRLMYGAKYSGHGAIIDVLAVGLWFYAISLPFPYGMLTLRRPGVDFLINLVCIIVFLSVGVWLVKSFNVFGAALSYLLIQATALVLRIVAFRLVLDVSRRKPSELIAS